MYRALAFVFLVAKLLGTPADAQSRCLYQNEPWSCFGSIELQSDGKEGPHIARMIRYTNGEVMLEIQHQGARKQYLTVLPSQLALYSGLTEQESAKSGPNNPFMFLDVVFTYPFMSLRIAHPLGPASISDLSTETAIANEKGPPAKMTATRRSQERIEIRLVASDGDGAAVNIL